MTLTRPVVFLKPSDWLRLGRVLGLSLHFLTLEVYTLSMSIIFLLRLMAIWFLSCRLFFKNVPRCMEEIWMEWASNMMATHGAKLWLPTLQMTLVWNFRNPLVLAILDVLIVPVTLSLHNPPNNLASLQNLSVDERAMQPSRNGSQQVVSVIRESNDMYVRGHCGWPHPCIHANHKLSDLSKKRTVGKGSWQS